MKIQLGSPRVRSKCCKRWKSTRQDFHQQGWSIQNVWLKNTHTQNKGTKAIPFPREWTTLFPTNAWVDSCQELVTKYSFPMDQEKPKPRSVSPWLATEIQATAPFSHPGLTVSCPFTNAKLASKRQMQEANMGPTVYSFYASFSFLQPFSWLLT